MKFKVVWRSPSDSELLTHFIRAADKPAMFVTGRKIEDALADDPLHVGEGRDGLRRLVFIRPFCVLFSVDEATRTVNIVRLKWVGN